MTRIQPLHRGREDHHFECDQSRANVLGRRTDVTARFDLVEARSHHLQVVGLSVQRERYIGPTRIADDQSIGRDRDDLAPNVLINGSGEQPVQYKTPATAVKAKRFMVTPFRLSTVAITPEVLRERYWTMVSIETGSNAGALRHGSIDGRPLSTGIRSRDHSGKHVPDGAVVRAFAPNG